MLVNLTSPKSILIMLPITTIWLQIRVSLNSLLTKLKMQVRSHLKRCLESMLFIAGKIEGNLCQSKMMRQKGLSTEI